MSRFVEAVPTWADPARIAKLLAPDLAPATAASLAAAERLRPRMLAWLDEACGAADPAALDPADAAILDRLAGDSALCRTLAIMAGAVWHAPSIGSLVLAADIAALTERYGANVRTVAITHAAARPATLPAGEIGQLEADGAACVAAWIEALPAAFARRVRLGWTEPALPDPGEAHRVHGPAIVRLLAADLATAAPAPADPAG